MFVYRTVVDSYVTSLRSVMQKNFDKFLAVVRAVWLSFPTWQTPLARS